MTIEETKSLMLDSLSTVLQGFVQAIPAIVGALIIILLGWLIARAVRALLSKVFDRIGFDKLLDGIKLNLLFEKAGIKTTASRILAQFVYLIILLVFIVAASETLGWTMISEMVGDLVALIPRILAGLVLFVVGYYIAGVIRDVIRAASESLGAGAGRLIAGAVYYFLLVVISLSTLKQMGVSIDIISTNVTLIIAAVVIAGAIAYGLAAREMLANTLSSYYGRNIFREGQRIRVGDTEGVIEELRGVSVILRTSSGRIVLPSQELTTRKVTILSEGSEA